MVFKFYTTDRSYKILGENFDFSANQTMWEIYEELSSEIVAEGKVIIFKDSIYNEINQRVLNMIIESNLKENLKKEMKEVINNDKEKRKEEERENEREKERKKEREKEREEKKRKEFIERYKYKVIDWKGRERKVDKYGYDGEYGNYVGEVTEYDEEDEEDIKNYKKEYIYIMKVVVSH